MYLSLYRKWRPNTFKEVVGQQHVIRVLQNAVKMGRIHHAYLFCGPRGTGKTTIARLFAKALNCQGGPSPEPCDSCANCTGIKSGHFPDLIEIDAASNRGIDEIRDLRERVRFSPIEGRYKVYIIDEVHMLTTEAFNALLKTLEEPPSHCIFIMATTEPQKIPPTISSRCQYLNFYRIPFDDMVEYLKRVAEAEGVSVTDAGLRLISKKAEGGLRDALGFLEQAISFGGNDIKTQDIQSMLGIINDEALDAFVEIVADARVADGFIFIKELVDEGRNIEQFLKSALERFRDLMIVSECGEDAWSMVDAFDDERERLIRQASGFRREDFMGIIEILSEALTNLRYSSHGRILLEMTLIKVISALDRRADGPHIRETIELEKPLIETSREDTPPPIETQKPRAVEPDSVLDLVAFNREWRNILNAVKKESITVHAFLIAAEPIAFDGNVLIIKFNYSFHKQNFEKEPNRQILEGILKDTFNREIKVECSLADEKAEPDDKEMPKKSSGAATKADVVDDGLVKSALEIFGGKVVKVE